MDIIRKILVIIFSVMMFASPVFAEDLMNTNGNINHDFSMANIPEYVYLKNSKEIVASNEIIIPENSVLKLKTICARKERRWHKSGYILTKLESFKSENSNLEYDVSEENVYLAVRKYEPLNKKEAAILTVEILVFTGASYYAPGVDVAYFFTKGAILRKKHPNWFKAGVMNAYENSIFWFWLKGKPIELEENSQIKIQSINEKKIEKLTSQIKKYNEKQEFKAQKKQFKKLKKENNEILKSEKDFNNSFEKEIETSQKEINDKNKINEDFMPKEELSTAQSDVQEEKNEKKEFKASKKQNKKLKKEIKKYDKLQKKIKKENIHKIEKDYFKDLKKQVKQDKNEIKRILKIKKNIEKRENSEQK